MMATNAAIGHGSKFMRSSDGTAGGTFTFVAEPKSISGPGLSRDTVDVTHMNSPDRWREFIAGLRDAGEVTVECSFDPDGTDVTNWLADFSSDTPGYYKIVFPDATEWGFPALITSFETSDPNDGEMTASVTYKITGKPSFIS